MLQFYDTLLELPMFIGIGRSDLSEIVSTTKFDFLKLNPNELLLSESDKANKLYILIDGILWVKSKADDHSYALIEEVTAPTAIQPERIFGLTQYHSKTYVAKNECNLLSLDKQEVLRLSATYLIFRLNYFNMICTQAQRGSRFLWLKQPQDIRAKFVSFVRNHSEKPAGQKVLNIKMQKLADNLHESRLNVSHLLNALNDQGLIQISRSKIVIPALEKL